MIDASTLASAAFAAALLAAVALELVLLQRQMRHVHAHRGAVPAPFAATVDLAAHQKAADYTTARARLGQAQILYSAAVLVGWTLLGGLQALREATHALLPPGSLGQQLLLLALFILIGTLLELPWSAWRTFGLEARFGFNRSSPRTWAADQLKSTLLSLALLLLLGAAALGVLQALGPTWGWLGLGLLALGFGAVLMVVGPLWIAPLFNRFTPLSDPALLAQVQGLLARCGFSARGVFVMDGSRRSTHANAYFTGLGRTKRVVLFDTLLSQLSPHELLAVLAHELGHNHHRHLAQRLAAAAVQLLAAALLLGWLAGQAWFYSGLGVEPPLAAPEPMLALLLFALLAPTVGIWTRPLWAAWSRHHEYQADAYAAAHTPAADLGSALLKLHRDNAATLTPDPLYVRFHHSHPTAAQRLARLGVTPRLEVPPAAHPSAS